MILSSPLILASQSPRRQQLLRDAGFAFEVLVRPTDEVFLPEMNARAAAVFIAEGKARGYHDLCNSHIILAADTVVAVEDHILGKPANAADAADMLQRLSGRRHSVVTGVTIYHKGQFRSVAVETLVTFRRLSFQEIQHYIEHYKPYDKAGAYGIQEWIGMVGITGIEGDYYNVMGLPMSTVYRELESWKR